MAGDAALVVICFVSEFQRRSAFRDGDVVKRRRRRTRATTAMGEKDGEQAPPNAVVRRRATANARRRRRTRDGETTAMGEKDGERRKKRKIGDGERATATATATANGDDGGRR